MKKILSIAKENFDEQSSIKVACTGLEQKYKHEKKLQKTAISAGRQTSCLSIGFEKKKLKI